MDNIYLYMIIALAILAVADLVVGVSNDAVNFLNSAIGTKAVSFKIIMIVASLGILIGALFSNGMMEVARNGMFNPAEFMFSEVMIIFMAVMITDILLLDFFNTLGLPTSTTVSIIFALLGASVTISLIKIGQNEGQLSDLFQYINTAKASEIVTSIILSVAISFSIGAGVQWITRLFMSYNIDKKSTIASALFGGVAITSIVYFIFMKGIGGTNFARQTFEFTNGQTIKVFLSQHALLILLISFIKWFIISYILIKYAKINIYKLIIIIGTFSLALAFAGNDLVNFIGPSVAAYQSYLDFINPSINTQGLAANAFAMDSLNSNSNTPNLLLIFSGLIMVLTLWFSAKARNVIKTSLDLSSQEETKERFQPNYLSRIFVRTAVLSSNFITYILPSSWQAKIDKQFDKPVVAIQNKTENLPAFDVIRGAVNLMVAAILISMATSLKLPLSTTYVTFMVAMGTSLADRAWGAESAVYRVAGVLNVIGGWFLTGISAFLASALVAYLLSLNVTVMFPILLVVAFSLIIKSTLSFKKKSKENKLEDGLTLAESKSIQGVINESAKNIAKAINRSNKIYTNAIVGLAKQDLILLKKNKKQIGKLSDEIDELRDNIFYFIKNLDESSISASNFYIHILGYLQDITQSLDYITKVSYKHVNNNHKKLKFNQIKELKEVDNRFEIFFTNTQNAFETQNFEEIALILGRKQEILGMVSDKIQRQVEHTRTEESSPKNTTLYFSILMETKDLLNATMNLLETYNSANKNIVLPN